MHFHACTHTHTHTHTHTLATDAPTRNTLCIGILLYEKQKQLNTTSDGRLQEKKRGGGRPTIYEEKKGKFKMDAYIV